MTTSSCLIRITLIGLALLFGDPLAERVADALIRWMEVPHAPR